MFEELGPHHEAQLRTWIGKSQRDYRWVSNGSFHMCAPCHGGGHEQHNSSKIAAVDRSLLEMCGHYSRFFGGVNRNDIDSLTCPAPWSRTTAAPPHRQNSTPRLDLACKTVIATNNVDEVNT